jgi:hypothetical protein
VDLGGALVRMHRAEVLPLVPVTILDELALDFGEAPLVLGDHPLPFPPAHADDTTSRRAPMDRYLSKVARIVRSAPRSSLAATLVS